MVTTLLVVRHTQALGNIQKTFQGHIDTDISEAGAVQLELLSERFRSVHIDAICSSPLLRARRTAEAINRTHHLPIELLPALQAALRDGGGTSSPRFIPKRLKHGAAICPISSRLTGKAARRFMTA